MRILTSKKVPTWARILVYGLTNFVSLFFVFGSFYLWLIFIILFNAGIYFYFRFFDRIDKWKKITLETDPFFQKENFTLASYGQYSFIAVSKDFLRIVNINPIIRINKSIHNIYDIYTKYPKEGNHIDLNGYKLYYIDIPVTDLESVNILKQGDAGWPYLGKGMNFGIRIKTKSKVIYDVDTPFSKEFCDEINKVIVLPIN